MLVRSANIADRIALLVCTASLAVLLVSMAGTVVLRYGASMGFLWMQDLTAYAFAILVIFSIPCALASNRHVRVDALGGDAGHRGREVIGFFILFLPLVSLLLYQSFWQTLTSVLIMEGSGQIGGLPGLFVVKASIPIAALLMALQGLARLLKPRGSGQA